MAELRLSTWGIKNPIPVALLFLAAVLGGAISYTFLPIKQFPNIVFPAVLVVVTDNGAAPAEIKTQITRPIEDAIYGISGVRDVQSEITEGLVDHRGRSSSSVEGLRRRSPTRCGRRSTRRGSTCRARSTRRPSSAFRSIRSRS